MDFSDEHYVKLFTRDTVTWRTWPWQARALFPLLMRAVDNAGIMRTGNRDVPRAVALMVDIPVDVVAPGLEALLADGTVEIAGAGLIITKFVDAQESRKTDAQKKRDQRERAKDRERSSQPIEIVKPPVTGSHPMSPDVTGGHPPSSALLIPVPVKAKVPEKKPRGPEKPADPRFGPLIGRLKATYFAVTGSAYVPSNADCGALRSLLARETDDEIDRRFRVGLKANQFETKCATFLQLLQRWNELAVERARAPPTGAAASSDTDWSNYREGDTARELFGGT